MNQIVKKLWKEQKRDIIMTGATLVLLYTLPLNLLGILLLLVIMLWIRLLIGNISNKIKPTIKEYSRKTVYSMAFILAIMIMFSWLKHYGWIGLLMIVIAMAAFRIWKGKKLFIETSQYLGELFSEVKK